MTEMNDIVKLAVDAYHGNVEKYSVKESMETLRQALVDANGGSTVINYKNIRDGKCNGLFTIVETILTRTVLEGLQGDEFFNALVETRNIAEGDENRFLIEDSELFYVAEAADGVQSIRRQRLTGVTEYTIPTSFKTVRIYEELNRVLSGRSDFNMFIAKVSESFRKKILDDIQALWMQASASDFGGTQFFPAAGSFSEDTVLDVIEHVEAAAGGKPATAIGTKKALRYMKESIVADSAKEEVHNMGYLGKFYGTPCLAVPQRHKVGSTEFTMPDDVVTFIAGDDKPIKFIYEGQSLIVMGDPLKNADLTYDYLYGEKYGLGIVLCGGNAGIGRCDFVA